MPAIGDGVFFCTCRASAAAHHGAVQRDGQRAHGRAHLWHELAAAGAGGEVPNPDVAEAVACGMLGTMITEPFDLKFKLSGGTIQTEYGYAADPEPK